MKIEFKKSFVKDLQKIRDKALLQEVKERIEEVEQALNLQVVGNLKQLQAGGKYFRIRIGDYRIGLIVENDVVVFVRFLHRKEIYRYFP
ncbi:MAG: type II toxin-antitoxin system RelE/ParE family toxin [candidate division KSB1 bacterium]|nr:type II toxin-antitoxin system RelE/ParE family toxin [candidate division KSB1 bacterium]MDZ7301656.1 type II toxin-antitoxin system RelE/ParE family toxin [candidate division KSB1 bacterium]MDZ7313483.1 type II toxin-antitoxin system RelE/ParE family toxin [candidate division KSB1 bacterium]